MTATTLLIAVPAASGAPLSTTDDSGNGTVTTQTGNEHGDQDTSDWDTRWGPMSQYDRNLLVNVQWANLWEAPTSARIAKRSTNPKVRAVANQLMVEHHHLMEAVAETAAKLNVPLPDEATPLQQSWQQDILAKRGNDADVAWANLTREAHGTVFGLISMVRSQTRNDVVREFAQSANTYVMRHMTLLESTGLVKSSSMVVGSIDGAPHQVLPSWNKVLAGVVLAGLAAVGTLALVRIGARYSRRGATE